MNKKIIHDSIMNVLKFHGPIKSRAMFGGYGIYYETAMFATIFSNELYFRTDASINNFFDEYDASYFTYSYPDGKLIQLPYRRVPTEIFENQDKLQQWIVRSYKVALAAKLKKEKKSKSRKTINLSEL